MILSPNDHVFHNLETQQPIVSNTYSVMILDNDVFTVFGEVEAHDDHSIIKYEPNRKEIYPANTRRHNVVTTLLWRCVFTGYLLTCTPDEDSNQPVHPRSVIIVFVVHMRKLRIFLLSRMRPVKNLSRLRKCTGWSESSLGTYARRYVFRRCGLYVRHYSLTGTVVVWLQICC